MTTTIVGAVTADDSLSIILLAFEAQVASAVTKAVIKALQKV